MTFDQNLKNLHSNDSLFYFVFRLNLPNTLDEYQVYHLESLFIVEENVIFMNSAKSACDHSVGALTEPVFFFANRKQLLTIRILR